eukprot:TRINITY_DN25029_c0_g1_i3.p1 TRINITY_DN25029_c0_g1~~TRINITY_DN25029_c0_g1_i3.p1  ORF type:complete len:177 (-),score=16.08 TRINITY_DN25029_c0_g1_i3:208-738(-)
MVPLRYAPRRAALASMRTTAPAGGRCLSSMGHRGRVALSRKARAGLSDRARGFFGPFSSSKPTVVPDHGTDINNCGCGFGVAIPDSQLVLREDMETGSPGWKKQLYGAAVYWHLASTLPGEEANADLLRGTDVLEVGCMLGGGARYLAEVCKPRNYVATDINGDYIEACRALLPAS